MGVKIRGQRAELGEIEHVLCTHGSVEDAVAVLQHDDKRDPWIATFVTLRSDDAEFHERQNNDEAQHVELWEHHFDSDAYALVESLQTNVIGRDFTGWTSMYDGTTIDEEEMHEWLDDTIETVLNGRAPGHVLEIGAGSGMILFNLTQGLKSYVALEPSQKAVDFLTKMIASVPSLLDKVKIHKATASDLGRLDLAISPNLVILNSVVQYFPSQGYLYRVLQDLLQLQGVETIFVGDIRSYALHQQFLVARALHKGGQRPSKRTLRRIMTEMENFESELLIDPAFFTSLQDRIGRIEHVEILPKKMRANNELSCFRYSAVIHVKASGRHLQLQIQEISEDTWIDFAKESLDHQTLSDLLCRNTASNVVAVSNIPYSKTTVERHVLEALNSQEDESQSGGGWLLSAGNIAGRCPSLSAIDLVALARQTGYRVEISWARQYSQIGGLDAIFHRGLPADEKGRTMFRFPLDNSRRPYHLLSNHPLQQGLKKSIQKELYKMLQDKLPSYMAPQTIIVLDKMPLNKNGKIDRRALASNVENHTADRELARQPDSEIGRQMRKIWGKILDIEPTTIRQDDDFFQLGGNSIGAMRVVGEARKVGLELTVTDIFSYRALKDVARRAHHS
ncbi:hypothetical protein JDV02_002167 [Purpureocillium takamizusanense]|uniref:Carrier domain-containing protein n=1 Tax=Purpureocillium takamizusanense TaxID=2060973 RepID=A0A9Q8QAG0_9HYPO|nr:uncharacterized protein JDV02_002167 [Purpureocillium takamizusanense]UNI15656.1 hypothetical protein JDV02_002167 [Purpureocillium takamizusanense]